APGDVVSYRTCGGGGYGPPEERDPTLVLRDVRDGKVSLEHARDVYRVAVDPRTWAVDEVETSQLRDEVNPVTPARSPLCAGASGSRARGSRHPVGAAQPRANLPLLVKGEGEGGVSPGASKMENCQ